MVLIIGFLVIAAWFIVFALLCVFGIILIVKGTKRVKNGEFPAPAGSQKRKFPPVVYIAAGIVLIVISLVILFAILDCFRGNGYDFLNKSLELLQKGFRLIGVFSAVCPLLVAMFFLVEGIRMARKPKTINDAGTYDNKRIEAAVLIISGALGAVILIALSVICSIRATADEWAYNLLTYFTAVGLPTLGVIAFTAILCVGIRTARKLKTINDADTYGNKRVETAALIILGVLGVVISIALLVINLIRSTADERDHYLLTYLDRVTAVGLPILGIIAFIVILLVISIRTALKLKTINDPDIRSGKRFQAVLLIISGTVTAAVLSAFLILDSYVQKTLPMTTGLDQHMLKYYSEHTKAVAVLDLVIVAITAALWIFGIRTTVKLKNIDDVGIYNKKLIRATTLIIFGVLGTVISFILLKRDIHDCYFWLNCLIDIIKRYS